jgi:di-N-acetylchitobiase
LHCRAACKLTTVAWNEDKELLCHAHSKGVKVVIKHNFDDVGQLCNATARQEWIKVKGCGDRGGYAQQKLTGLGCIQCVQMAYKKVVVNYADGVNIDTEKPMHGAASQCLGSLVHELRHELEQHALTKNAQVCSFPARTPR